MSYPCVDPAYFDVSVDGELSPNRKWQFAHRASAVNGGATFTPASNPAPGTQLFATQVQWTNTTGISQRVYALMTQGPQRYSIDGLKHLVIVTRWGITFGAAPADPVIPATTTPWTDESRVRGLADAGTGTVSGSSVATFIVIEDRQPTGSVAVGDLITLPAGQTMKARVQVSWQTDAWGLNWWSNYGDPVQSRIGKVGPVRLDLFSLPVIP